MLAPACRAALRILIRTPNLPKKWFTPIHTHKVSPNEILCFPLSRPSVDFLESETNTHLWKMCQYFAHFRSLNEQSRHSITMLAMLTTLTMLNCWPRRLYRVFFYWSHPKSSKYGTGPTQQRSKKTSWHACLSVYQCLKSTLAGKEDPGGWLVLICRCFMLILHFFISK